MGQPGSSISLGHVISENRQEEETVRGSEERGSGCRGLLEQREQVLASRC
jgi:hypothetical protein